MQATHSALVHAARLYADAVAQTLIILAVVAAGGSLAAVWQ
jgi:hypothetical protein